MTSCDLALSLTEQMFWLITVSSPKTHEGHLCECGSYSISYLCEEKKVT